MERSDHSLAHSPCKEIFWIRTGHFRFQGMGAPFESDIPVRVDWTQGKLLPEQNCESTPVSFKVIPKELGYREDLTFVRLCSTLEM